MGRGLVGIPMQMSAYHRLLNPQPSEISEVFQEVVTTQLLKVLPEAGLEPARF